MTSPETWAVLATGTTGAAVFVFVLLLSAGFRRKIDRLERIRLFSGMGAATPDGSPPHPPAGASPHPARRSLLSLLSAITGGMRARPPRSTYYGATLGLLVAVLIGAVTVPVWGLAAIGAEASAVLFWRRGRAKSRAARLKPQIVEALDLIAATVKSGFGFVQAIELASRELAEPIAGELRAALREIELGVPVDDALRSLAERVDDRDLSLAISALLIQRRVGGGLYEILNNISGLIRDRSKVEGEVRSLTAQARLSARVVGLLPVALAGMMALMQPTYINVLVSDPIGRLLIVVGGTFELIGFWLISRLARIDF